MPDKKYFMKLNKKQLRDLQHLTRKGTTSVRTIKRARILLLSHDGLSEEQVMIRVETSRSTVQNIRRRFQTEGISLLHERCIRRKLLQTFQNDTCEKGSTSQILFGGNLRL